MGSYNIRRLTSLLSLLPLLFSSGCDFSFATVQAGQSIVQIISPATIANNPNPSSGGSPNTSPIACDPLNTQLLSATSSNGATNAATSTLGLVANLKYLPESAPRYVSVQDYQHYGTSIDATLFFNSLNVPTRSFSLGFGTQTGSLITNQNGNTLYEYFSLHFQSLLQLSDTDALGSYQFAILSDDGSIFRMDTGNGLQILINNDGTHPTRLAVSTTPVTFDSRNTKFPITFDYYQGPRYQIALVLLWRPWQVGGSTEPLNGSSGNELFYDWTQIPSVPTASYAALTSRGWVPIGASNFALPPGYISNPCAAPVAPTTTTLSSVVPAQLVTNVNTETFSFSSNYATATFQCSLDGASLANCVSPLTTDVLADGPHQFVVYASQNGNKDATGANYSWTIDTVAPVITATSVTSAATSFTASWTTDKPTSTRLIWGAGMLATTVVPENLTLTTQHQVTVSGLTGVAVYSYVLGGQDQAGNMISSSTFRLRTPSL